MSKFKQFLSEDIINVLDKITMRLKSGDLSDLQKAHMNLIAALRVYIVQAHNEVKDGGTPIGINGIVGDVSDKEAFRAIATFAKAKDNQQLTSTQAKFVYDLLAQGKEDGYTDLLQAIEYVKNKLQSLSK